MAHSGDIERPFAITIEPFKQEVAKFTKHCDDPSVDFDALTGAWRLIGLYYLNLKKVEPQDEILARSYYEFAQRRFVERELEALAQLSHT